MEKRDTLVNYLNEFLQIADFRDYGPQGVQVEGREEVNTIITAVSANLELFDMAVQKKADMIIVHHGILWDNDSRVIKGGFKQRIKRLLDFDISLLAYHLPLDKHPQVGNNAVAAQELGLHNIRDFGDVGVKGDVDVLPFNRFLDLVQKVYGSEPVVFAYGPDSVTKIGICSGAADRDISRAIDEGLDVYVTGEVSEPVKHLAKEGNIHFIAAGHYSTEKLGIRALGDFIAEKFKVRVEFVDIPNPI